MLAAGCWHAWDDLEARESNDSPAGLCSDLCGAYEFCIGPFADCSSHCAPQVANCSTQQMSMLQDCITELEDCDVPAVAQTVWNACLIAIGCYQPQ